MYSLFVNRSEFYQRESWLYQCENRDLRLRWKGLMLTKDFSRKMPNSFHIPIRSMLSAKPCYNGSNFWITGLSNIIDSGFVHIVFLEALFRIWLSYISRLLLRFLVLFSVFDSIFAWSVIDGLLTKLHFSLVFQGLNRYALKCLLKSLHQNLKIELIWLWIKHGLVIYGIFWANLVAIILMMFCNPFRSMFVLFSECHFFLSLQSSLNNRIRFVMNLFSIHHLFRE